MGLGLRASLTDHAIMVPTVESATTRPECGCAPPRLGSRASSYLSLVVTCNVHVTKIFTACLRNINLNILTAFNLILRGSHCFITVVVTLIEVLS